MIRRGIPFTLIPLCIIAGVLACIPWLHSFPSGVIAVPLFGAAILSVLVPVVAVGLGARRLWISLLVDVVAFVIYTLLVVLHDPIGFGSLVTGIYRGPSQILTFALPLVSPRSLFVAPVALTWLAGTLAGECLTRRWFTVLPYPGFLISFGLAYAATVRAVQSGPNVSHASESLLAALLLAVLLLMRVGQTWIRQDETAESTQADGILPLRGLVVGAVTTVVVALVAGLAVQSSAFTRTTKTPQRVPSINDSRPLSPVDFIAALRPTDPKSSGQPAFSVQTNGSTLGYFAIANVDQYDGSGWSFTRTFRPSGGVLPDDTSAGLRSNGPTVTQQYQIASGPLTGAPWMPFVYRPQKVTGMSVNIDADSGMIVPSSTLTSGEQYRVQSDSNTKSFDKLSKDAQPATSTNTDNAGLPPSLLAPLDQLIAGFAEQLGTPSSPAIPFLQALQRNFQQKYALTGAAPAGGASSSTPPVIASKTPVKPASKTPVKTPVKRPTPTKRASAHRLVQPLFAAPKPTAKNKPTAKKQPTPVHTPARRAPSSPRPTPPAPTPTSTPGARAGSSSYADVIASVLSQDRSGTPEQYATLMALIARRLGVPARLASGFRVQPQAGRSTLPSGHYDVSTAQAWTWVEVPIVGVGWVVLDPSPGTYSNAQVEPTAAASPSPTTTPTQNALITKSNNGHAVAPKSKTQHAAGSSKRGLVISLLITFGALLLALLLLLALRKPVRRRKRRSLLDPRLRTMGAWRESIDVLTEAGLPDLSNLTSAEIATLTGLQFGPDPQSRAGYIGHTANAAAYSTAVLVSPEEADAAWQAERALRRQVNRQLGIRGRFTAWLRYHRSRDADRTEGPASWASEAVERRSDQRAPRSSLRRRSH
ncbi:MAG: transglutaminase domain-containing protein [Jatrophihabitantaceae bacterium]